MQTIRVTFFGSSSDSVLVAENLHGYAHEGYTIQIAACVTQPPRAIGREKTVTPTPVDMWAKSHQISVLTFENSSEQSFLYTDEDSVINALQSVGSDLLVSASYGQKIPFTTITSAKYGGLNVHPSPLPRWRGADPTPWTILSGDQQTGATVVTLSEHFDEGKIIAQKKLPVLLDATPATLRATLFALGAETICAVLPDYLSGKQTGIPQDPEKATYARRLKRDDGYVSWSSLQAATQGEAPKDMPLVCTQALKHTLQPNTEWPEVVERLFRALHPWPGLWTTLSLRGEDKRVKILSLHLQNAHIVIDTLQVEGKNPVSYAQFCEAYEISEK